MIGLLDDAHEAVKAGLNGKDVKASADVAFKLFRDLGLSAAEGGGDTFNVNLSQTNNQLNLGQREIDATNQNVLEMYTKTKELGKFAKDIGDFTKHLFRGTEALPTPESQMAVLDVEALPPVNETPEDNFNLTELDPDE
jgi:hypothetical protein